MLAVRGARGLRVERRALVGGGGGGRGRGQLPAVRAESLVHWRRCWGAGLVHVGDEPPHLLQGVSLHEDVVLGQQQSGYLGELTHGRAVRVRYDGAQFVQCVVQVVHPTSFASVDRQSNRLTFAFLGGPARLGCLAVGLLLLVVLTQHQVGDGVGEVQAAAETAAALVAGAVAGAGLAVLGAPGGRAVQPAAATAV